jgi:gluconate 2-dehydrogenase gamma chain
MNNAPSLPPPSPVLPRRAFLVDSTRAATVGWLMLQIPLLEALASCVRNDARTGEKLTHLTSFEAQAFRAFAKQIIPSGDGLPGAEEAGVVHFVDLAFGIEFFAEQVMVIRGGLADLDARAKVMGGPDGFASLTDAQQVAVMQQIEQTPFFATARTLVVIGTFADPSHGGNRGMTGWTIAGIEHRPSFTAPFGWYDEQAATSVSKSVA